MKRAGGQSVKIYNVISPFKFLCLCYFLFMCLLDFGYLDAVLPFLL